jgi:NAD(P)-dependent dehydrogenase (short-subunit alcohol dehydrogenase family)
MSRQQLGMAINPKTGKPEEIAKVADESSFVNGTVITADAGWSAY